MRNQCDGCSRGMPLVDGLHRGVGSYDLIGCTANRYVATIGAYALTTAITIAAAAFAVVLVGGALFLSSSLVTP